MPVLGMSVLTFVGLARRVRTGHVSSAEERTFRALNGLPDGLAGPVWVVMQAGNLAAVPVAALLVRRRRPALGTGVAAAGVAVWALSKVVKRVVGRGRPADHLPEVHVRGRTQTGRGFPSGHAAVAVALAATSSGVLSPAGRLMAWAGAAAVGGARLYVGAHLPLDVLGGFALGTAAGAVTDAAVARYSTT